MTQTPSSYRPGGGAADATSAEPGAAVTQQAQEKLEQVVDHAQGAAAQVTAQARQQATSQLESQKERAVDSLVTLAQALRQTGQHLQEQQQGTVGRYVEQTAERVEGMTNHLRSRDVPELVAEAQDFARQQPGLFLAGAVALGFVGARFLMSSGRRATAQRRANSGSQYWPASGHAHPADISHGGRQLSGTTNGPMTFGSASTESSELQGSDRSRGTTGGLDV